MYNPTQGTRLIWLVLSDGRGFLDPSTACLTFILRNTEAGAGRRLKLRSVPITISQRIRILCKGTVLEDLHEVPFCAELLAQTDTLERVDNDSLLSNWSDGADADHDTTTGIPPNGSR